MEDWKFYFSVVAWKLIGQKHMHLSFKNGTLFTANTFSHKSGTEPITAVCLWCLNQMQETLPLENPCVSLMVNSVTSQHQFSLRLWWSRTYALCDLYSCCCKQFSAQIAVLVTTQADLWLICLATGGFKNILCIQKEKRVIKDSQNRPKHLHGAEDVSYKNDRDTFAILSF